MNERGVDANIAIKWVARGEPLRKHAKALLQDSLAELRGCDFWTADRKFFEAVKGTLRWVKFIGDYSTP